MSNNTTQPELEVLDRKIALAEKKAKLWHIAAEMYTDYRRLECNGTPSVETREAMNNALKFLLHETTVQAPTPTKEPETLYFLGLEDFDNEIYFCLSAQRGRKVYATVNCCNAKETQARLYKQFGKEPLQWVKEMTAEKVLMLAKREQLYEDFLLTNP